MKTKFVRLEDIKTHEKSYQVVIYDETAKCLLCSLPVNEAGTGGTAICGSCDRGKLRKGGVRQRYTADNKMPSVWSNSTEQFEFSTEEEAFQKIRELHTQGIKGWDFIVNPEDD